MSDLLTEKKAFRQAHAAQQDLALLNGDGSFGRPMMKENPESRQAEGENARENSDIAKKATDTKAAVVPTEGADPVQGYDVVKRVNRELPADYPERARRYNNQVRDERTNLGRGKPSMVTTD